MGSGRANLLHKRTGHRYLRLVISKSISHQSPRAVAPRARALVVRPQSFSSFTPLCRRADSKRPDTIPSSASSSATPRKSTDTYTQGTRPQFAENLVTPFASESIEQLYAKRSPSDPSETPADQSSSTSVDPPHPSTTAKLQHTSEEAVGSSAAVRYCEPSWEDEYGKNSGVGLQNENAVVKHKDGSKLPEVNAPPDEEQGTKGLEHAWERRE